MEQTVTPNELVQLLMDKNMTIATAESCTGGMLAATLTRVPGVSAVFAGGYVTYATTTKHMMIDVSRKVLRENGAISRKCAKQMAQGAASRTGVDCALSITGNAGPSANEDKPVGRVYIGCSIDGKVVAKKYQFEGTREEIREQAVTEAIQLLYRKLIKKQERIRQDEETPGTDC